MELEERIAYIESNLEHLNKMIRMLMMVMEDDHTNAIPTLVQLRYSIEDNKQHLYVLQKDFDNFQPNLMLVKKFPKEPNIEYY